MLSFCAGRSVRALHMEVNKTYTITTVKKDEIKKKYVLLGVLRSSRDDLVVLRNVEDAMERLS